MKSGVLQAIEKVVTDLDNQATVAEIAANIDKGDVRGAILETASLAEAMANALGKSVPLAGTGLSLTSLAPYQLMVVCPLLLYDVRQAA